MKILIGLIGMALLSGCHGNVRPPKPQIVTVVVTKIVPVPDELTADCDLVPKRANSYGEAKRLANARHASLLECRGRMRLIRGLKAKK